MFEFIGKNQMQDYSGSFFVLHLLSDFNSRSWYEAIGQLFELILEIKCSKYFVTSLRKIIEVCFAKNQSLNLLFFFITALNVDVTYHSNNLYEMKVGDNRYVVTGSLYETGDKNKLTCTINGVRSSANVVHNGDSLHIFTSVSNVQFYLSK